MARHLRIDLSGGWHHVTTRGNERRFIFHNDTDRVHFLEMEAVTKVVKRMEAVSFWDRELAMRLK